MYSCFVERQKAVSSQNRISVFRAGKRMNFNNFSLRTNAIKRLNCLQVNTIASMGHYETIYFSYNILK